MDIGIQFPCIYKNRESSYLCIDIPEDVKDKIYWIKRKTYSYLIDDGSKDKKSKGTKKCIIKGRLKFENYKNCLEAILLKSKINNLEKKMKFR